jgi:hypothetical protein
MSSQQEAQKGYNDEMHSEAGVERVRGSSRERETTFTSLDELREREPSRWSRHRRLLGVVGWTSTCTPWLGRSGWHHAGSVWLANGPPRTLTIYNWTLLLLSLMEAISASHV